MFRRSTLLLAIFGSVMFPSLACAQGLPPVVYNGAVRVLPYVRPVVQGTVSVITNRDRIIRGAAAIGGPVRNETTPAYCLNQGGRKVCYNSQGQVFGGR